MIYFYLKLVGCVILALLLFAYMQFLQKKKEEEADRRFQEVMKTLAAKAKREKEKNERTNL